MGGLAVATLLTLVCLPALYVTWFRIKRPGPGTGPRADRRYFEPTGNREAATHDDILEDACLLTQPS